MGTKIRWQSQELGTMNKIEEEFKFKMKLKSVPLMLKLQMVGRQEQ
jgi:hypothetical protein